MSELLLGSVWTRKPKTVTLTASLGPGVAYLFDGGSGEMTTERFLEEYQPAAPSPSPAPGVTFEQWWKASKYRQVIYAGASEQQIARDGWNAALASLSQPAKREGGE